MFDWMELQVFEMQLLELYNPAQFGDLRVRPQIIN